MNLEGGTQYDYSKNGRQDRIDDLTNGIAYLKTKKDSVSKIQIDLYNEEIISIQDCTGFNWYYDKEGNINERSFSVGMNYNLKVVDLPSDSVAVTKVMQLTHPYVKIRVGESVWVK